jgi:hypothetical protein
MLLEPLSKSEELGRYGMAGDPVERALSINTAEELTHYLSDLSRMASGGLIPVENDRSADFIEAAGAWVEGMDVFLAHRGIDAMGISPWTAIALVFSAALVYE